MHDKIEVASILALVGAIGIGQDNQFSFASGLRSPIYCDNRLLLARPVWRKVIVQQFIKLIEDSVGNWDAIAGVPSAGIPFAAWIAHERDRPLFTVRPAGGGLVLIRGDIWPEKRAILIEDLVTTGESAVSAVLNIRDAGLRCDHCFSIVDYEFTCSADKFAANKIQHQSLTGFEELLQVVEEYSPVDNDDIAALHAWHQHANEALLNGQNENDSQ